MSEATQISFKSWSVTVGRTFPVTVLDVTDEGKWLSSGWTTGQELAGMPEEMGPDPYVLSGLCS